VFLEHLGRLLEGLGRVLEQLGRGLEGLGKCGVGRPAPHTAWGGVSKVQSPMSKVGEEAERSSFEKVSRVMFVSCWGVRVGGSGVRSS